MKNPWLAKTVQTLQGLIVPIALLALWQWLSSQAIVNPQILPAPTKVLAKWWEYLMPMEALRSGKIGLSGVDVFRRDDP